MASKKILRMGTQKTSIEKTKRKRKEKTKEVNLGQDSLDIDF